MKNHPLLFILLFAAFTPVEIMPSDDAYVTADVSGNPAGAILSSLNFGASSVLVAGYYFNETGENEMVIDIAFFKLDLSGYTEIRNVAFTFTIKGIDSEGPSILQIYYVENDAWTEDTINFRNAPPPSNLLGEVIVAGPGRITLNLTKLFEKDKVVTLAMMCKRTGSKYSMVFIASKEADSDKPVLRF